MMNDASAFSDADEYISKEGFGAMQKQLEMLKNVRRIEIAKKLEFAKSLGDLSENAEYAEAKEEHMSNESEIARLEHFLSRVKFIEKTSDATVHVGSTVVVCGPSGENEHYMIVGTQEVDVANGRISNESPFGKAFLGKQKGDTVDVRGPKGTLPYRIVDVR